jgi:hypothetical protein
LKKKFFASKVLLQGVILALLPLSLTAQTPVNEYKTWTEFKVSTRIFKDKVRLHLSPEIRFNQDFSIDKYFIESGVRYDPFDFLCLGTSYRFIGNNRETKSTVYLHRYAFDATFETKVKRFEPEFRLQFTNYSDENLEEKYLRYKPSLQYDIEKCKITPFISAEAFQNLAQSRFEKIRYGIGAEYKLIDNHYLELYYKMDYFLHELKNRHILGLSYRINL